MYVCVYIRSLSEIYKEHCKKSRNTDWLIVISSCNEIFLWEWWFLSC